jgi:cellulose synthase/poly-beta-1,6-N-acetylglucosamine synthase-like glycosyltransferase
VGLSSEVIVIDNNSDESFRDIIRRQCQIEVNLIRSVHEPSPGLSAARHRGVEEAAGDLLVFLDDDVELGAGWLRGMLKGFSDDEVGIVGGPSIPRFGGSIPDWFWDFLAPTPYGGWHCTWVSLLDIGQPVPDIDPNYIWGLNFGIRRSVLRELGGFHPDLVPAHLQRWQGDGETGLTLKARAAGIKACYVPEALVYHHVGPERLTPDYFKRRARYQGVCDSFTRIRAGGIPVESAPPFFELPGVSPDSRPWGAVAAEVRQLVGEVYREGFEFHQREAAADQRLMRWIRRDTFWDADIRAEMDRSREFP